MNLRGKKRADIYRSPMTMEVAHPLMHVFQEHVQMMDKWGYWPRMNVIIKKE